MIEDISRKLANATLWLLLGILTITLLLYATEARSEVISRSSAPAKAMELNG